MGQKLDGKAEIEEKIDGNSEMLPPLRPPPMMIMTYISSTSNHLQNIDQLNICAMIITTGKDLEGGAQGGLAFPNFRQFFLQFPLFHLVFALFPNFRN